MALKILPDLVRIHDMAMQQKVMDNLLGSAYPTEIGGAQQFMPPDSLLPPQGVQSPQNPRSGMTYWAPHNREAPPELVPGPTTQPPAAATAPVQGEGPATGGIVGGLKKVNEIISNLPILSQLLSTPTREANISMKPPWQETFKHESNIQEQRTAQAMYEQMLAQMMAAERNKAATDAATIRANATKKVGSEAVQQRREEDRHRTIRDMVKLYDTADDSTRELIKGRLRAEGVDVPEEDTGNSGNWLMDALGLISHSARTWVEGRLSGDKKAGGQTKPKKQKSLDAIFGE